MSPFPKSSRSSSGLLVQLCSPSLPKCRERFPWYLFIQVRGIFLSVITEETEGHSYRLRGTDFSSLLLRVFKLNRLFAYQNSLCLYQWSILTPQGPRGISPGYCLLFGRLTSLSNHLVFLCNCLYLPVPWSLLGEHLIWLLLTFWMLTLGNSLHSHTWMNFSVIF